MPFVLGLTGNIACGKSAVGAYLVERYGVDYVDADRVVHQLYEPGRPEVNAIARRFGTDLLSADGTIDRRRLGDVVMADPGARADLEGILYPAVLALVDERVARSQARVVVIDAVKLIEAGLAAHCDTMWVVTCDRASQMERLMFTRGFTAAQATLRIDAQEPVEEKLGHASAVIDNRGTLPDLYERVDQAWQRTVAPDFSPTHVPKG